MSVSAGGFTQPLRSMFAPLYRMRKQLDPSARLAHALDVTKAGPEKSSHSGMNALFIRWCAGLTVSPNAFSAFRAGISDFTVCMSWPRWLFCLL